MMIRLRPALQRECRRVYLWRWDSRNTGFSVKSTAAPVYSDHESWYAEVLADPNRDLLVAELDGQPVGVLRYDVDAAKALVSIYMVPGFHGKGLSRKVLDAGSEWLKENRKSVKKIVAEILAENIASVKTFQAAGYVLKEGIVYELAIL